MYCDHNFFHVNFRGPTSLLALALHPILLGATFITFYHSDSQFIKLAVICLFNRWSVWDSRVFFRKRMRGRVMFFLKRINDFLTFFYGVGFLWIKMKKQEEQTDKTDRI